VGLVIIFTSIKPVDLLIIASSGGEFVMGLYTTMLIVLNQGTLSE
jgi:hypothetical protein